MDAIDPVWLFGGIALVSGILIGVLVHRRLNPSIDDIDQLKTELERSRTELAEYKTSVNRHFSKTSDLVNELTQDYVKVYQHLAEGAEVLGNNPKFAQALEQSQGRVLISVEDDKYVSEKEAEVIETAAATTTPAGMENSGDTDAVHQGAADADQGADAATAVEPESDQAEHRDAKTDAAEPGPENETSAEEPEIDEVKSETPKAESDSASLTDSSPTQSSGAETSARSQAAAESEADGAATRKT